MFELASLPIQWKRLKADRSGVALTEFAVALPVMLSIGLMAIESTALALAHLKVSQVTLNLADNISRMGTANTLSTQQLREVDVNDAFEAVRDQGESIRLVQNGRVILSSLEFQTGGAQRIHWQRCIGLKSGTGYDSSYGTATPLATAGTDQTTANAGVLAPDGMGPTGAKVSAPEGSGIMFVEVNYEYKPVVKWVGFTTRISYVASFFIRDPRDLRQIYNVNPAASRATCNLYAT